MNHPPSSKTWTDFRSLYVPENKPQNPKGLGKLQRIHPGKFTCRTPKSHGGGWWRDDFPNFEKGLKKDSVKQPLIFWGVWFLVLFERCSFFGFQPFRGHTGGILFEKF